MASKKIPVQKLNVGMFVEQLDRPWIDTPFFFHKKLIKTQDQIDKLISNGIMYVMINTEKGADLEDKSVLNDTERTHLSVKPEEKPKPSAKSEYIDPLTIDEELPRAKEIRSNVSNVVKNIFNDTRMGKAIEVEAVKEQVSAIVESVFRNRDALLCLTNLKDYDDYTFMHSVNIGILAVSFGRHLGMTKRQLENIGFGGVLHDIGKTMIPESILNKPGKYTMTEYEIMKRHVNLGGEILRKHDHIPEEAMLVALQHHERFNGTGYPNRLFGSKISLEGQIASICDVYDALTYERVYHNASTCHATIKRLYEWGDTLFVMELIENFVKCIGIYPLNSLVELNTGQCGVVVSVNQKELLRPKVRILLDSNKKKQESTVVDLAAEKDADGNYIYSIVSELNPAVLGLDINQYEGLSVSIPES
ncbi:MAG: HD-GYP domain-containing protein [Nitrospirae bacterium]|nr:HD-GYP domain-containing protein [Nitrospirota bacterium]